MYNYNAIINKLNKAKMNKSIVDYELTINDGKNIVSLSPNSEVEKCEHQWYLTTRIDDMDCQPMVCKSCGKVSCICQLANGFENVPFERFGKDMILENKLYKRGTYLGDFIYDHFYPENELKIKKSENGKIIYLNNQRDDVNENNTNE